MNDPAPSYTSAAISFPVLPGTTVSNYFGIVSVALLSPEPVDPAEKRRVDLRALADVRFPAGRRGMQKRHAQEVKTLFRRYK